MNLNSFDEIISKGFIKLPLMITATIPGEFKKQFIYILDTEDARQKQGIVYVWLTEKPIPRTRGESRVLYIGKTVRTLRKRYQNNYIDKETSENNDSNWIRWPYIIGHYGPITFWIAPHNLFGDSPKAAERLLLTNYFKTHLEIPPFNRMSI